MLSTVSELKECYSTLNFAKAAKLRWIADERCNCKRSLRGEQCQPAIFVIDAPVRSKSGEGDNLDVNADPNTGLIEWGDTVPHRAKQIPGGAQTATFDFGYYDEDLDAFWHATEGGPKGAVLVTKSECFGVFKTQVYCVTCESRDITN